MSTVVLNGVLERTFRFNPAYELVPFDHLPVDQKALLNDLAADPDFYGVLLPRGPGSLAIKSVCRESAALIDSLVHSGSLSHLLRRSEESDLNQAVAGMVLDQVLEMDHCGSFISGPQAYSVLYASSPSAQPEGFLARLSQDALQYAQALAMEDVGSLSTRLYCYNRLPLTGEWSRRLPSEAAVSEFLGISRGSYISPEWTPVEMPSSNQGWFQWRSRGNPRTNSGVRHGYKLYVSPLPEALPAAFRSAVKVLEGSAAHAFKVGNCAVGLLRPDKLVIYFEEFEPLLQTAQEIAQALAGFPVHGVPFTAEINDGGLLSWGIDPEPERGALSWRGVESWRTWITNRLAVALVSARNQCHGSLQPWQFAIERLRLEDVDTTTWTPGKNFGNFA